MVRFHYCPPSECSSAWLERVFRVHEAVGSNPTILTNFSESSISSHDTEISKRGLDKKSEYDIMYSRLRENFGTLSKFDSKSIVLCNLNLGRIGPLR